MRNPNLLPFTETQMREDKNMVQEHNSKKWMFALKETEMYMQSLTSSSSN